MDRKRRAMMAEDLCERATRGVSGDDAERYGSRMAFDFALGVGGSVLLTSHYRSGLAWIGITPEQIDAAVASIERGEWPADSLAGRLLKMRNGADEEAIASRKGGYAASARVHEGMASGLTAVLDLLGVTR